jgi:hypothetical protein
VVYKNKGSTVNSIIRKEAILNKSFDSFESKEKGKEVA